MSGNFGCPSQPADNEMSKRLLTQRPKSVWISLVRLNSPVKKTQALLYLTKVNLSYTEQRLSLGEAWISLERRLGIVLGRFEMSVKVIVLKSRDKTREVTVGGQGDRRT